MCIEKKQKVQEAVRDFDLNKSDENRKRSSKPKRITNSFCRKCKQNFNRDRCKQMNEMRKKKEQKNFGKFLKERKLVKNQIYQKNDSFEYLKKISSEIADNNPDEVRDFLQNFDTNDRNFA